MVRKTRTRRSRLERNYVIAAEVTDPCTVS
jgi:hypothetical protein